MFGLKDQRYPSVLAGLEMETEAIWNHLDFVNLNVHAAPPQKNTPLKEVSTAYFSSVDGSRSPVLASLSHAKNPDLAIFKPGQRRHPRYQDQSQKLLRAEEASRA
jgi:hypothetical protein